MFREIFEFELKFRLKRYSFYIFTFAILLMAFSAVASDDVNVGFSGGNDFKNSPFNIMNILLTMSTIAVFITTAIMSNSIIRDYDLDTYGMFFTKPISKSAYFFGRFSASFLISYFVIWGAVIGILLACIMPWQDPVRIGPFSLQAYLFSLVIIVLPNVFFLGAFSFSLATFTRSLLSTYIGILVLFTCYGIGFIFTKDMETQTLAVLLDPFGFGAFLHATKYWTVAEKNSLLIPLKGLFLGNRILWGSISLLLLGFTYSKFRFAEKKTKVKRGAKKEEKIEKRGFVNGKQNQKVPAVVLNFTKILAVRQFLNQVKVEFLGIVRSIPFIIILIFAVLNVFGNLTTNMSSIGYGTSRHPLTFLMIDGIQGGYVFFLFIIVTFYTGELIWKERAIKINDITDSLPVANWIPFVSKLTAMILVIALFLIVGMCTGISYQLANGFYNIKILQYLKTLFFFHFIGFVLLTVLGMFIQTIVNNKFLGYMFMVIYFVILSILPELDLVDNLYHFSQDLFIRYSDMNLYGPIINSATVFTLYRLLFAVLLCSIGILFWLRGSESSIKIRLKLAKLRYKKLMITVSGLVTICFFISGCYIYYNTHILNEFKLKKDLETKKAGYEKTYKKYALLPQPRITDIKADVDIYPAERDFDIRGTYILKNKTAVPIDSIHFSIDDEMIINSFTLPGSKQVLEDKNGYYIYELTKSLQPQDSIVFKFDLSYKTSGFVNQNPNTDIVKNGTFINNYNYFPHIGYLKSYELSDKNKRKKYGLPPPVRMADVNDPLARMNNYISNDADEINFETIVSTSTDQIAIAPGYLQKEWIKENRRFFHYKMDIPMKNFFCYLSGRYKIKKDSWKGVNIEIYYHDTHEYNLDKMINSTKKGLEYFSANFSPYPHKQYRIIEFPRYLSGAQAFANTIPYSESAGFIADLDNEEKIDMVFYITAHELAHQWWGHQVVGANVQGATLMSESLAQYSTLMIMEKEYGKKNMRKFLKYELDRYLSNRGGEVLKEQPLYLNENQGYIHYNKGSLVMYALRDYIGEEVLNGALSKYLRKFAYQEPPYTNSIEFLQYIREVTPDSLQYVIEDMFETITLYENKTTQATYKITEAGKYQVDLTIEAKKIRADSLGHETEIAINDWIYIAVFGEEEVNGKKSEKQLYYSKHKIDKPILNFRILVDELPVKAGLDPYSLLIDRIWDNNMIKIEKL